MQSAITLLGDSSIISTIFPNAYEESTFTIEVSGKFYEIIHKIDSRIIYLFDINIYWNYG